MRPGIGFGPLPRSGVGFARTPDNLRDALQVALAGTCPPCDVRRTGEDTHRVTLAVASSRPGDPVVTT